MIHVVSRIVAALILSECAQELYFSSTVITVNKHHSRKHPEFIYLRKLL